MTLKDEEYGLRLTDDQVRRRRGRSIALALALAGVAVLFFVVSLVKGPGVLPSV